MSKRDEQWIINHISDHSSGLIRYAYLIVGDIERAREMAQDTFLALVQEGRGSLEGRMPQWLFRVCRNKCINALKKQNREVDWDLISPGRLEDPSDNAREQMEKLQQLKHFCAAIEKLSLKEQEVLRLKYSEGLSYRQISDITGYSESNVGYLLHHAIKKLHDRVEELV